MIGPEQKGSSFLLTAQKLITVLIKHSNNTVTNDYSAALLQYIIYSLSYKLTKPLACLARYSDFINQSNRSYHGKNDLFVK